MMNHVELIGRVSNDPKLEVSSKGKHSLFFNLAVGRSYVKDGEDRKTDFIPISVFGKLAELIADKLKKGPELVLVEGELQTWNKEKESGAREKQMGVTVNRILILGKLDREERKIA